MKTEITNSIKLLATKADAATKSEEALAKLEQEQEPNVDNSVAKPLQLVMKWADIYAAQTGNYYAEAALDPSKSAQMDDTREKLAFVVAKILGGRAPIGTPTPPAAQPEQEIFGWVRPDNRVAEESNTKNQFSRGANKPPIGTWMPVFISPPKCKPVTDGQIDEASIAMRRYLHISEASIAMRRYLHISGVL